VILNDNQVTHEVIYDTQAIGVVPDAIGSPSFVVDPCTQKALADNTIQTARKFGNATDVLLNHPAVTAIFDGYYQSSQASVRATIQAASDTTPLARAEWVKVIGAFFNLEDKANAYFDGVMKQYNCVSQTAKQRPDPPRVAWVEYSVSIASFDIE
jgi:ABC-type Fe3+-hydroxamate transport system substrate-binding protein